MRGQAGGWLLRVMGLATGILSGLAGIFFRRGRERKRVIAPDGFKVLVILLSISFLCSLTDQPYCARNLLAARRINE